MEAEILCGANASNMKFYFNEERYGILPKAVKEELIFPLDDMLLAIATKLNDRELGELA